MTLSRRSNKNNDVEKRKSSNYVTINITQSGLRATSHINKKATFSLEKVYIHNVRGIRYNILSLALFTLPFKSSNAFSTKER